MKPLFSMSLLALAAAFAAPSQAALPTPAGLVAAASARPGLPSIETAKRKAGQQVAPKRKSGKQAARKKGK